MTVEIWHHCAKKRTYATEEIAAAALAEILAKPQTTPEVLEVYPCRYREEWHIGRPRRGYFDCSRVMLARYVDHPHVWAAMIRLWETDRDLHSCHLCTRCSGWHMTPVLDQLGQRTAAARMRKAARRQRRRGVEPRAG